MVDFSSDVWMSRVSKRLHQLAARVNNIISALNIKCLFLFYFRNLQNTKRWSTWWHWLKKVSVSSCLRPSASTDYLCSSSSRAEGFCFPCRTPWGWIRWHPVLSLHHRWNPRREQQWRYEPTCLLVKHTHTHTLNSLLLSVLTSSSFTRKPVVFKFFFIFINAAMCHFVYTWRVFLRICITF